MLTLVLKALIVLVAGLAAMLGNPLIRLLLRRIDHASAPADADAEVDVAESAALGEAVIRVIRVGRR